MKSISVLLIGLIGILLVPQLIGAEDVISPTSSAVVTPTERAELFVPKGITQCDTAKYIKADLKITQQEYRYFIEIKGATNLPDQTVIKVSVYYENMGKQKLINMKYGWAKDSAYNISIGPYDTQPPFGNYSGSVEFNPIKQLREVKKVLGEVQGLKTVFALPFGTPQQIEQERDKTFALITEQARQFQPLFSELTRTFKQYSVQVYGSGNSNGEFNPVAWQKWLMEFEQRVDTITRTTSRLDPFRVFAMVTRRKVQIEGICHRLRQLTRLCNNTLTETEEKTPDLYEKVLNEFSRFELGLKEGLSLLGVIPKFDRAVLEEGIKSLQERIDKLKNRLESVQQGIVIDSTEQATWINNWQQEVGTAIFKLTKELPVNNYSRMSELSVISIDLLKRFEAATDNVSNNFVMQFDQQRDKAHQLLEQLKSQYLNPE
ncbi:hypothetical protein ACFL5I_00400 [Planctomycetota bacterium]